MPKDCNKTEMGSHEVLHPSLHTEYILVSQAHLSIVVKIQILHDMLTLYLLYNFRQTSQTVSASNARNTN